MEKALEILQLALSVVGMLATVAAPILMALKQEKAADRAADIGAAMTNASGMVKAALEHPQGSLQRRDALDQIGDVVSSYTNLKKYEAAARAETLINKGKIKEAGLNITLDPAGSVTLDASQAGKKIQRKIRAYRDKALGL